MTWRFSARNRTRSRPQRQARFAVLAGVIVFLLLQAGLAGIVELWLPSLREPLFTSRVEHFVNSTEAQRPPARTVLFLGTSRLQHGIRVASLQKHLSEGLGEPVLAFNYGLTGAGCLTNHLQWRRLKEAGARPDLVVVELVPTLFHEERSPVDSWLQCWSPGEMDRADIRELACYEPSRNELYLENVVARMIPAYGHRRVIVPRLASGLLRPQDRREPDWFVDVKEDIPSWKYPAALEQARAEHAATLAGFHPGAEQLRAAEELLADLHAAGVPTIVLVAPEGPVFRSWYRPGAWSEIESLFRATCTSASATFVSARDWFGEDAFFDSHHLTIAGGERFSTRLADEVLLPVLRELTSRERFASAHP